METLRRVFCFRWTNKEPWPDGYSASCDAQRSRLSSRSRIGWTEFDEYLFNSSATWKWGFIKQVLATVPFSRPAPLPSYEWVIFVAKSRRRSEKNVEESVWGKFSHLPYAESWTQLNILTWSLQRLWSCQSHLHSQVVPSFGLWPNHASVLRCCLVEIIQPWFDFLLLHASTLRSSTMVFGRGSWVPCVVLLWRCTNRSFISNVREWRCTLQISFREAPYWGSDVSHVYSWSFRDLVKHLGYIFISNCCFRSTSSDTNLICKPDLLLHSNSLRLSRWGSVCLVCGMSFGQAESVGIVISTYWAII